jgi:hypothetical protein
MADAGYGNHACQRERNASPCLAFHHPASHQYRSFWPILTRSRCERPACSRERSTSQT